jgi:hypothetical protein
MRVPEMVSILRGSGEGVLGGGKRISPLQAARSSGVMRVGFCYLFCAGRIVRVPLSDSVRAIACMFLKVFAQMIAFVLLSAFVTTNVKTRIFHPYLRILNRDADLYSAHDAVEQ